MTSEQRLDRLERIAKLFVSAGLRARRNMKDQEEKINIIINNQIEHDERFAGLNQSLERSQRKLNQSIERSNSELSKLLERSHSELNQSIERSHSELGKSLERSHSELNKSLERSHSELNKSLERSHSELNYSIERSHSELSQSLNLLAQAQTHTNQRLNSLIEIVERDRNGNSH
jgi:hypothetical protein